MPPGDTCGHFFIANVRILSSVCPKRLKTVLLQRFLIPFRGFEYYIVINHAPGAYLGGSLILNRV
ncbi:hypothetical protein CJ305_00820 [Leeuwenhoekiella nanhaiensis]|uniref:Uncharacterized protein n=1 Tax=Leeuwenhoekiella nanhaiensis TaxID=1655491 RepID=A0A2G1VVM1_9FLAO|nr:hypothetical protein CJ305_00820 [Leeuwenhoekiella nanhaiensis]